MRDRQTVEQSIEGYMDQTYNVFWNVQARLNKYVHFRKCTYLHSASTIKPETPSILVSNESSGSPLSSDVPGYEIWTQIV